MKEVLSQCGYFVGQRQINRGAKDCKSRIVSFTKSRDDILVGQGARTPCSAQDEGKSNGQTESQQHKGGSGAYAYSLCREETFHFLFQKQ